MSSLGGIRHSPVAGCSAASCDFGVLAGEGEHASFYAAALWLCHAPAAVNSAAAGAGVPVSFELWFPLGTRPVGALLAHAVALLSGLSF